MSSSPEGSQHWRIGFRLTGPFHPFSDNSRILPLPSQYSPCNSCERKKRVLGRTLSSELRVPVLQAKSLPTKLLDADDDDGRTEDNPGGPHDFGTKR